MATITETLRLVFAADSQQFEKGIGASLAQLEVLRGALLDMTAPITQLQEEMLFLASDFETSIQNVNTLLGDDAALIETYKNGLIALSTEVPQSAQELSDALYQAISAGIDTGKALEFIGQAGKAATAGMTSTYVAVDGATSVMNAFNISADKSNEVFDYMFQAVRDGKVTFEQLSSQMGMLAPTAAAAGIELKQMMASIATATGKLRPEQAFTGLAGAITELNTPASKAAKALKRMGYESLQAALKEKTLQEIMVDLVNSGQKIDAIFGREAARAVNAVGGSAEKSAEHLEHMNEAIGATDTAFEKVNSTFANSQQHLQNVRDAVKISIGQEMMPILTDWNNVQASILEKLMKTPSAMQKVAGVSMLFAKGLSGIVNTTGTFGRNLVAIQQSASMLKGPLETVRLKTMYLKDDFGKLNTKMNDTKIAGNSLKGALGAAGLAAAIAFTAGQLIELYGAVNEYRASIESLEKATEKYETAQLKKNEAAESEEKKYSNVIVTLQELEAAYKRKEDAKIASPKHAAEIRNITESLKNQGIVVSDLADLNDKLKKARGYKKVVSDRNAAAAAVKALGEETTKALSVEEQLEIAITKLAAYGVEFTKTADAVKDLEKAEKQLAKEQQKAAVERAKVQQQRLAELEKYKQQYLSAEQQMWLKAQEGSADYYTTLGEFEEDRWRKQEAAQNESITALTAKFGEESAEVQTQHQILEELEKLHYQKLDDIDTARYDFKETKRIEDAKKADEDADKSKADKDQELADTQELYGGMIMAGMGFFDAMGQAAAGDKDAFKNQFKAMLLETLKYVEAELILGEAASFIKAIFNPTGLIKNVPLLIAAEGALAGARAMIASFDTSGMPVAAGMAYVEPGDVVLNPGSGEQGVLNALARQIAGQLNTRPVENRIYLDGRQIAENNVRHVRQMNSALPSERTVFDE